MCTIIRVSWIKWSKLKGPPHLLLSATYLIFFRLFEILCLPLSFSFSFYYLCVCISLSLSVCLYPQQLSLRTDTFCVRVCVCAFGVCVQKRVFVCVCHWNLKVRFILSISSKKMWLHVLIWLVFWPTWQFYFEPSHSVSSVELICVNECR